MHLKPLAEQLLLINRLKAFISDPCGVIKYVPLKSKKFYKPHVSYYVFDGRAKLMFIITGENLIMNKMEIKISSKQHREILNLTMQEYQRRKVKIRSLAVEPVTTTETQVIKI